MSMTNDESPMSVMWITIGMSDTSAFYLTLAKSSLLLSREFSHHHKDTTELTELYTASVGSVSKRLEDPVDGISDGVVGTIVGFACLDVSTRAILGFCIADVATEGSW